MGNEFNLTAIKVSNHGFTENGAFVLIYLDR